VTPEFKVTLDIAQIAVLVSLVAGLVKMSMSVNALTTVTGELAKKLEGIAHALGDVGTRVAVLEDRDQRGRR
jgi:hypothetical protein